MIKNPYNYKPWLNDAVLSVVKKTFKTLETKGLYKDIHFYIEFITKHPLVKIPDFLKSQYPENIIVVIQNQFYNLKTDPKGLSVELTFNGKVESLYIPWLSMVRVLDPVTPMSFELESIYKGSIENSYKLSKIRKEEFIKNTKDIQIIKFPKPKD